MSSNIFVNNFIVGRNTVIEPTAVIRGIKGNADTVVIGDNCYIGHDVQIICDNFSIGDYSKIQHHTNIHGYKPCKIGHNAWIGQYTIIDSIGGTTIGNNCGIGAHSQLWSHIKYGDTLEGCRFFSDSKLEVGNDVWFVGHCIISPIKAEDRSMALVGSVVTRDMKENHVYAGSPATDITEKTGPQFKNVSIEEKYKKMLNYLQEFDSATDAIKIVSSKGEIDFDNKKVSFFDVSSRMYTKNSSDIEIKFMRYLLPEKAKFIPIEGYK